MTQRTRADSPTKECSIEGCNHPLRARGLCSTHYNQTYVADRHRQATFTCTGCGIDITKDKTRGNRYARMYCSEICRQWDQFGAWSTRLPASHPALPQRVVVVKLPRPVREIKCEWCGVHHYTAVLSARFCSRDHKLKAKQVRRRGREFGASGTYTWMDITRLWRTFDRCCAYCRQPTALSDIQAEHVTALSCGGANNLSNLLPSCGPCNADKRDLSLNEWSIDRKRRNLPPVITEWDDDDARYAHLVQWTHVRMTA